MKIEIKSKVSVAAAIEGAQCGCCIERDMRTHLNQVEDEEKKNEENTQNHRKINVKKSQGPSVN